MQALHWEYYCCKAIFNNQSESISPFPFKEKACLYLNPYLESCKQRLLAQALHLLLHWKIPKGESRHVFILSAYIQLLYLCGWQHPEAQSSFSRGWAIHRPARWAGSELMNSQPPKCQLPARLGHVKGARENACGRREAREERGGGQKGYRMLVANISCLDLPKLCWRSWCLHLCSKGWQVCIVWDCFTPGWHLELWLPGRGNSEGAVCSEEGHFYFTTDQQLPLFSVRYWSGT